MFPKLQSWNSTWVHGKMEASIFSIFKPWMLQERPVPFSAILEKNLWLSKMHGGPGEEPSSVCHPWAGGAGLVLAFALIVVSLV